MTEKELRKLNRHDILELLVEQSREASRLRLVLEEREERLIGATSGLERLKCKLDEKDAQIEKLKGRLDGKDLEMSKKSSEDAELAERLKTKLDEKDAIISERDATIERLKAKLSEKDERIEALSSERLEELKKSGFTDGMLKALSAFS